MCINKEVSLTTFLFSWGIAFYIINRNINLDLWYGLFLLIFSFMQFIDFILWVLYENKLIESNYNVIITSIIIPLVLISQLFIIYFGKILYKNKNKFSKKLLLDTIKENHYPKLLIIIIIVNVLYNCFIPIHTTIGKSGHLNWGKSMNRTFYRSFFFLGLFTLGLIYPFLDYIPRFNSVKIILLFGVLSLLFSFWYTECVGSYWCFIANILAIFFLFSPYLDNIKSDCKIYNENEKLK